MWRYQMHIPGVLWGEIGLTCEVWTPALCSIWGKKQAFLDGYLLETSMYEEWRWKKSIWYSAVQSQIWSRPHNLHPSSLHCYMFLLLFGLREKSYTSFTWSDSFLHRTTPTLWLSGDCGCTALIAAGSLEESGCEVACLTDSSTAQTHGDPGVWPLR